MKIKSIAYYSRELKTIFLVIFALTALAAFITYRSIIAASVFSGNGMMVLLGLAAAGCLSMVIRIYYRVMVIKYHEQ